MSCDREGKSLEICREGNVYDWGFAGSHGALARAGRLSLGQGADTSVHSAMLSGGNV